MDIKNNTVSSDNQMINSSEVSFLGNKNASTRILVLGNSITRHGPLAEIGWNNDWGMAASTAEKDYVHRLYAKLTENGQDVYMRIRQASYWETHFLEDGVLSKFEEEKDFQADIVVFRLGDNVINAKAEEKVHFESALEDFMSYICAKNAKVLFTTCFWVLSDVDSVIERVAKKRGDTFIPANFATDESNTAVGKFEHAGVACHPGDDGMEKIAEVIYRAIQQ